MKRLSPIADWVLRDGPTAVARADARVLPLLRAIAESGTLASAARRCGIPYRTAWGAVEAAARDLGTPLLTLERGRGASPTPFAIRWLAADDEARKALERAPSLDLGPSASRPHTSGARSLRIAASHDIALAELRDRWSASHGIALEFHGSAESLDALHARRADLAGFHVPADASLRGDPLYDRVRGDRDALIRFITRRQGLILAKGNPRRVRSLRDLVSKRLSLVNRQPGSGTRVLLERLLDEQRIDRAAIAGYGNEEFTHAAVAATIAAGRADAGLGVEAAAAQLGLAFVPLATERYLFACIRRALDTPRIAAFRELLADAVTTEVVTRLSGYALDRPGEVLA